MAGTSFTCTMQGVDKAVYNMSNIIAQANLGMMSASEEILEQIYDLSQIYVPVETELLKSTGAASGLNKLGQTRDAKGRFSANEYEGSVTYGPANRAEAGIGTLTKPTPQDVDYAVIVHERLGVHHDAPTKAKYLEDAALEIADTALMTMASIVHQEITVNFI